MSSFNYAFQTGIGLNPYLLKNIADVFGKENAPQYKVDNIGFLNLLKSQNPNSLKLNRPTGDPGQIQFLNVKYRQRAVVGQTQTSDTCATGNTSPYMEVAVPLNIYRQFALYLEDGLVQEYTDDAARTQSLGLPPTKIMNEMLEQIKAATNAVLVGLDQDMLNSVVFGNNAITGSNATVAININKDITQLSLTDGLTKILTQTQQNIFASGSPQIVGSGLFLNFMNQQAAKGLQFNGLNTKLQSNGVDFYFDQYASTILGSDQIAVFSPNDVQIVEFDRFTGVFSGQKGISYFGNFVLPLQVGIAQVMPISFDYQLRYLDCPESVAAINDYYGTPISGFRGWQMIISKKCGLFQPPTNAFKASDYLVNTNGVLRYTITNN